MKTVVLGAGTWGTALARLFALKGIETVLYGRDSNLLSLNSEHRNLKYFPDIELPKNLSYTIDLPSALKDSDIVIFSVPSKAYSEMADAVNDNLDHKVHVVSTAKGFEKGTLKRLSSVLRDHIAPEKRGEVITLVGPSYASEVVKDKVTAITACSLDEKEANYLQHTLSSDTFRVYTLTDEIGAECAAALKNVIALGAGMLSGLEQGENAKAALVTRGIHESMRFGLAMGGKTETYLGLSGIGDLMLTCNSMKSRNYSLGVMIGRVDDAKSVLKENTKTVEGVDSAKYITALAKRLGIELPITFAINDVLFSGAKPSEKMNELMVRSLKPEND